MVFLLLLFVNRISFVMFSSYRHEEVGEEVGAQVCNSGIE